MALLTSWTPKGWHFIKNNKMLFFSWNIEFRVSKPQTHFIKVYFLWLQHLFCTYGYLFELIFALLTFGDKGVRVSAGSFLRPKIMWYAQNLHWVQNSILSRAKHIFPISLINSWNLRKWNISFIMLSLKYDNLCVNSPSYLQ